MAPRLTYTGTKLETADTAKGRLQSIGPPLLGDGYKGIYSSPASEFSAYEHMQIADFTIFSRTTRRLVMSDNRTSSAMRKNG
jgi:hypothetical protein